MSVVSPDERSPSGHRCEEVELEFVTSRSISKEAEFNERDFTDNAIQLDFERLNRENWSRSISKEMDFKDRDFIDESDLETRGVGINILSNNNVVKLYPKTEKDILLASSKYVNSQNNKKEYSVGTYVEELVENISAKVHNWEDQVIESFLNNLDHIKKCTSHSKHKCKDNSVDLSNIEINIFDDDEKDKDHCS